MKATGIVRRIDELGRVVIPKEIRRTLRIREGDPLEIFTDREGEVILKKYSPVGELGKMAEIFADSLSQTIGCTVCITDNDQIVAASGSGKKDLKDKYITEETIELLRARKNYLSQNENGKMVPITEGMDLYKDEVVCPIISEGDVIGGIVLLGKEGAAKFGATEQKVAASAADFLGRQMEQ
ncbi:MAG: AbrB/MazE/SpoVT family DNA-binding domain-containing protein [Ruminococcus sp.]|nr:AbrB/MazE/SpoVT family DNA-binding domain-containing protein [Ruminococcus sp.]